MIKVNTLMDRFTTGKTRKIIIEISKSIEQQQKLKIF